MGQPVEQMCHTPSQLSEGRIFKHSLWSGETYSLYMNEVFSLFHALLHGFLFEITAPGTGSFTSLPQTFAW
jgi:hypothetical protein